jgi:predicted ATPase
LPTEIADQIIDRTDGVPLFIEELTKSVVESGWMTDAGDHYSSTGPVVPLAIPTTLQASLLARLDRLAPTREVAQIAAALGRQFSHELISAVAEMSQRSWRASWSSSYAPSWCSGAGRRRMPRTPSSTRWCRTPPTAPCCALAGSNCMAGLPSTLERQFPEIAAAQPELMAQHCAKAGLVEQAIEYWGQAGRLAVQRSTMAEAAAHFGNALNMLASLPKSPQRRSSELSLQLALAGA